MAYDEELADQLRLMLGSRGVTEKKTFGGLAFLLGGNMAIAASSTGGVLVRVDPAETDVGRARVRVRLRSATQVSGAVTS